MYIFVLESLFIETMEDIDTIIWRGFIIAGVCPIIIFALMFLFVYYIPTRKIEKEMDKIIAESKVEKSIDNHKNDD